MSTILPADDSVKELAALRIKVQELNEALEIKSRQEREIRDRLEQYVQAADGANDGLWDWNLISNEVFVSDPWKKMLGYASGELPDTFTIWEQLLHPEDKEATLNAFEEYIQGLRDKQTLHTGFPVLIQI
jgi:PAS domain-containing protein